jgi:thymidylate synthase (FAD)
MTQRSISLANGYGHISVTLENRVDVFDWKRKVFEMAKMTWQSKDNLQFDMTDPDVQHLVWGPFEGKVLPTVLEQIQLIFIIRGMSRSCSHQFVRGRVGWAYNQQSQMAEVGLRDFTVPAHLYARPDLRERLEKLAADSASLYNDIIGLGLPPQSARYVLPEGSQTDIYCVVNFPAFRGFVANRTCLSTNDEINIVARGMRRELLAVEPQWEKYLQQPCDRTGVCPLVDPVFPCCGKHPQNVVTKGMYSNASNNCQIELARLPDLHMHESDKRVSDAMMKFHSGRSHFDEKLHG